MHVIAFAEPKALYTFSDQTIRLEIIYEASMLWLNKSLTTLRDEVFILYAHQPNEHRHCLYDINVYNGYNLKELKETIPLPVTEVRFMAGCNVSNCVYVCVETGASFEIVRIAKDEEHKFKVSPWKTDFGWSIDLMTVSANGNLIIFSRYGPSSFGNSSFPKGPYSIHVFSADGTLQYQAMLSPDIIRECLYVNQKSNGNVVLAYAGVRKCHIRLQELDFSGGVLTVVREFKSSFRVPSRECCVSLADDNDRMIIAHSFEGIELLDSEFNLIGVYHLPNTCNYDERSDLLDLIYDSNRHEIVRTRCDSRDGIGGNSVFTIFRFTED